MTLINNYILKLRYRINDRNSKVYTDEELQLYLEDGVYSLQGTGYFRKFTVINDEVVRQQDSVTSPTVDEDILILLQTEILIKYAEAEKYSRETIYLRDLRGTIDTTKTARNILFTIDRLEKRLSDNIKFLNKNKNRDSFAPRQMTPHEKIITGEQKYITFKTKYLQGL